MICPRQVGSTPPAPSRPCPCYGQAIHLHSASDEKESWGREEAVDTLKWG